MRKWFHVWLWGVAASAIGCGTPPARSASPPRPEDTTAAEGVIPRLSPIMVVPPPPSTGPAGGGGQ